MGSVQSNKKPPAQAGGSILQSAHRQNFYLGGVFASEAGVEAI